MVSGDRLVAEDVSQGIGAGDWLVVARRARGATLAPVGGFTAGPLSRARQSAGRRRRRLGRILVGRARVQRFWAGQIGEKRGHRFDRDPSPNIAVELRAAWFVPQSTHSARSTWSAGARQLHRARRVISGLVR